MQKGEDDRVLGSGREPGAGVPAAASSPDGDAGATTGTQKVNGREDGNSEGKVDSRSAKKSGKPASFPKVGQVVNWLVNSVLPRPWK